ncbi:hypothetical protein BC941DRAFT_469931 [Chlamydoabsidia padenii]|nr:hypothetical protein BC941DRAFT_469931 [Chlamydoabsidia padenii]
MHSLSQSTQHLHGQELLSLPSLSLQPQQQQHQVLYSGDMILCTPQSRFSRQKRCYCILTPTCLVRFKSFDKAKKAYPDLLFDNNETPRKPAVLDQDQKIMTALEHVFAVYKIQLSGLQQAIRIHFVDSVDVSRPPGSLTLVPCDDAVPIWMHAIRTALEPYLPGLVTISSAEQFSAIERTKKQNDQDHSNTVIHKVILKTTKITSKSPPSNHPIDTLVEQKDIYIPVIFLLGQNSLYILSSKSDHEDYRRYVARDRYGLMAITGIIVHDSDDTITIDLCSLQGPSHRLKLISSVGRLLVCAIQRAIQRLVPHFPTAPYTLVCPSLAPFQQKSTTDLDDQTTTSPLTQWRQFLSQPWKQQKLSSQSIQSSSTHNNNSLYSTITTRFDAVLMAYCAALNLDKRRFGYNIIKSQHRSRLYGITILPSNEINGNFASYSKYELLALFRALRHMDFFDSVSFKDIRLAPLATWLITKNDSWTQNDVNSMCFPTMLANELFLLLSHNNRIRSLDLRASYYTGAPSTNEYTSQPTLALTRVPTTMSLARTTTHNDGSDGITPATANPMASSTLQPLPSISTHASQQCTVQAILLAVQTNQALNLSTLLVDNHVLQEQDIDLFSQLILVPPIADIDLQPSSTLAGLRHLSLRQCQLSTACIENVILAITKGPLRDWIEHVDLQENQGLISTNVFNQVWKQCKRLSQLGISCQFNPGDTLDLQHKVMNKLDLSGSQLDDDHLGEICAWLTHHATTMRPLTKTQFDLCLVLTRCGLHGQHVHKLVHAVSVPHHRRLHFTLQLGDNPLIKQVVYQPWLWSCLSKYGPTCLSLEKVVWESATLRELFDSLVHNNMIERLDLSGALVNGSQTSSRASLPVDDNNTMADYNGRTSISTTASSNELTDSTIHNASPTTTFDPSTVQALALLFEKMARLVSFSMDAEQQDDIYTPLASIGNKSSPRKKRLTNAGHLLSSTFRFLALHTTTFSTTLTTLSIKHHGLGDDTIQALCQWCKQCPSLQSLNVDGNLLTIAGFRFLLDLVKTNTSIHHLPRPELDFRRELHRLESQAWQLQESEGELQYLVIHMVGVDSRRAHALIEDQAAAREAIMVDRSQLPIVANQLEQQVSSNAAQSTYITVQPYWPSSTTSSVIRQPSLTRPRRSSATSSIYSFYQQQHSETLSEALPPPTCPLPAIPSFTSL